MLRRTHLIVDVGNPTGNGERLIIERTMDGLATARARGRAGGCRKIMARSVISQEKGALVSVCRPAAGSRCDRCRRENNLQVPPGDLKAKISLLFLICYVWLNQFIQL